MTWIYGPIVKTQEILPVGPEKNSKKNPYGNFSDGRNLKYTTGCIENLFAVLSHGTLLLARSILLLTQKWFL